MKHLLHHIALIGAVFAVTVTASAATPQDISDTLHEQLAASRSASDSIIILENIYDLAVHFRPSKADSIAEVIYMTAKRSKNYSTALDMLRQRTNLNLRNDSVLRLMKERVKTFPKSVDRYCTETFIGIMLNSYNIRKLDEEERRERFGKEVKQYIMTPPGSVYERIVLLHSVCANLARETKGELLVNYIDKLGHLIDSVPDPNHVLHNTFYVQAAIDYTLAGHGSKALAADRKLLQIIDSLEFSYINKGRPYRYYDANRYISYARMLGNWPDLSQAEIEEYYKKAIHIRDNDIRARNSYKDSPRPDIYYAMAHKDYATVMRLVPECIDKPQNKPYRRRFLKYLLESARALGDKATALEVSGEYIALLEQDLSQRVQERYKELQIIYDVNEMKAQYKALRSEKQMGEYKSQRVLLLISLAFAVVLLTFAVILVCLYRKARTLARTLSKANDALRQESHNLRESQAELTKARDRAEKSSSFKSDFIKSLSRDVAIPLRAISEYSHLIVDCTDSTGKPYLERYADLIDQNCRLVNTIAADVLQLSNMDPGALSLHRVNVDLHKVVISAIHTVAPRMPDGVALTFDEDSPQVEINTDPSRLQQILFILISNCARAVEKGTVSVSYIVTTDRAGVQISVTVVSDVAPVDKTGQISGRYASLDKDARGVGSTVSRMLARSLGGDLSPDTSYDGGARFVVYLPFRPKT